MHIYYRELGKQEREKAKNINKRKKLSLTF